MDKVSTSHLKTEIIETKIGMVKHGEDLILPTSDTESLTLPHLYSKQLVKFPLISAMRTFHLII